VPTALIRGVELSWSERGEGAPVLLVHETATSSRVWDRVAESIAESGRAIAYDRRGWGGSTTPDDYRRTTVEEQSEDAAVLLESLGASPAVVCGAGLGAVIAIDLLLRRPELVTGAVLIEPPVLALLPEATAALSDDRVALREAFSERGAHGAVNAYLSGRLAALSAEVDAVPSALTGDTHDRPQVLFAELGAATGWTMPLVRLAGAEVPSRIVTTSETPPLLREAAGALAGRLGNTESVSVQTGLGPPHLARPAEVAELALGLASG
jgi:pimeloyl-ACP methyl ester carboxylesterase